MKGGEKGGCWSVRAVHTLVFLRAVIKSNTL